MKFSDCLTSVMNGVRVRRKSWGRGLDVKVEVTRNDTGGDYTFTVEDAQADDWQIVVPGKDERVK